MPLHIRKMRKNDLEPMYQLLSDPAVMKYLEPPFTKEKTESFLNTCGLTTNPRIYAVDNEEGLIDSRLLKPNERSVISPIPGAKRSIAATVLPSVFCFM